MTMITIMIVNMIIAITIVTTTTNTNTTTTTNNNSNPLWNRRGALLGCFRRLGREISASQSWPKGRSTPGSHSKISRYKMFVKGWVAQKPLVL